MLLRKTELSPFILLNLTVKQSTCVVVQQQLMCSLQSHTASITQWLSNSLKDDGLKHLSLENIIFLLVHIMANLLGYVGQSKKQVSLYSFRMRPV